MNKFKFWLIRQLGGFTEFHMIVTKDGIYLGSSKDNLVKAELKK